jgi:hypothetical protein
MINEFITQEKREEGETKKLTIQTLHVMYDLYMFTCNKLHINIDD